MGELLRIGMLTLAASLISSPAMAYVDPGTATLILQGVIGAVAAAGLFFRTRIKELLSIFGSLFRRDRAASPGQADDANSETAKN